jgi:hypothetical protein
MITDPVRSRVTKADKMFGITPMSAGRRYYLKSGGLYLHWSAKFLTDNSKHAWTGSIENARACRRKFDAAAGCKTVEVA